MSRHRSRYAPDEQVRRAARLAAEMGIKPAAIRLGADGSVTILDTGAQRALALQGNDADAALIEFENSLEPTRRP